MHLLRLPIPSEASATQIAGAKTVRFSDIEATSPTKGACAVPIAEWPKATAERVPSA